MSAVIPKGYVFVARDILHSTLWQRPPEDRVLALTSIVLANHHPIEWYDGQDDVRIERGQFARSWPELARLSNLSLKSVRNGVARLARAEFMSRKSCWRYSLFTIPKYAIYQDRDRYGRGKELPEGAVLLARKVLESRLWQMSAQDRVVAITCLLVANYSSGPAEVGGQEVMLSRGQFSAPWSKLASWCKLPVEQTQESVARLMTADFLTSGTVGQTPVFTITNYELYQDPTKYTENPKKGAPVESAAPMLPFPDPPVKPDRAGSGQEAGSLRAGSGQDPGRIRAANKNLNNINKGEEGGRGEAPAPELTGFETRGAPPPLPTGSELARAYDRKFRGVMGFEKTLNQVSLFLSRGGNLEEGLRAVAEETRPALPIWKILDPLLDANRNALDDWIAGTTPKAVEHGTRDLRVGP